jgi:transaldolase
MGRWIYRGYRSLLESPRWMQAFNAGARPQRLLFASTGTKDLTASDVLYVRALAAPFTVNTMPEETLNAFACHGEVDEPLPADGGNCEEMLRQFSAAGIDLDEFGTRLQQQGAAAFVRSWNSLMDCLDSRTSAVTRLAA